MNFNPKDFGIHPYDGLLVAYLPPLASVLQEYFKGTCKVYAQDGIVLDMLDTDAPRVKWWRVREAARQLQMGIVEPMWSGPACDLTAQRLEELRARGATWRLPGEEGKLFMRAFSHGPWVCLDEEENARAAKAIAADDLAKLDERFVDTKAEEIV